MDPQRRNAPSLPAFKQLFKNDSVLKIPQHFYYGKRQYSILLARIRNNCSNLHNDLFNNHLREDAHCPNCGSVEDAEHYFFQCTMYRHQRLTLFYSTRPLHPLSPKLLLFGDENKPYAENIAIVEAVLNFIKDTKRF